MNLPLYNALNDEKLKNQLQFHMPGHLKGRGFEGFELSVSMDLTELSETDNLHNPEGVIKASQEAAAKAFGSKKAYYLVNGSTSGVLAMILGLVGEGEKVIADRFSHKSLVSALALSGANPVWVCPEIIEEGTMWGGINPSDIEEAIEKNPDARAVYITSPNYFGFSSDLEKIAEIVHRSNMLLLVDGAHGAHYSMSELLPVSAIKCGADAVCMSLHKTLPSLTQTAILLTNRKYDRVEAALKMVQTSSPSYLLSASCEYASAFYENCPKDRWEKLYEAVKRYFPEQLEIKGECVKFKDFTRLNCPVYGNPFEVSEILREEYDIAVECTYGGGIVAILNSFHTEEDIKRLRDALDEIKTEEAERCVIAPVPTEAVLTPREAFFAGKKKVNLRNAVGAVSAEGIMVYPPGVYQVLPGEVITEEAVVKIKTLLKNGAEIPQVKQSNCLIFDE